MDVSKNYDCRNKLDLSLQELVISDCVHEETDSVRKEDAATTKDAKVVDASSDDSRDDEKATELEFDKKTEQKKIIRESIKSMETKLISTIGEVKMTGVVQIKVFEVAKLQYSSFLRLSIGGAGDHCLLPLSSPGQAP